MQEETIKDVISNRSLRTGALTIEDFEWLEFYYWRLTKYINSSVFNTDSYVRTQETVELKPEHKRAILREVYNIEMALVILSAFYAQDSEQNRPVVAIHPLEYKDSVIYYFSSLKVASQTLGANPSGIKRCCSGVKKTEAGYEWWDLKYFRSGIPRWLQGREF